MLAESELNRLERQLTDFNLATKARQDALDELTLTYGKLLEDYRVLRSDYEEEKESREKYKKLARGQDRNPFVLVLIDADGYVLSHQHFIFRRLMLSFTEHAINSMPFRSNVNYSSVSCSVILTSSSLKTLLSKVVQKVV